jgi:hypothetical protein
MEQENNSKTNELSETKKSRKKYMKEYYLKKRHQMIDGKFVKQKPKKNQVSPLTIKHGEFVVSFD